MNYARIESLREIGKSWRILAKKKAAIIGCGALGSNAALLLAKTGIGSLIIADRDIVEEENLPLTPYSKKDVGIPKVMALKNILLNANPALDVEEMALDVDHKNIDNIFPDIILDCTDNMETRFLLNDYCIKNKMPLVHAAALGSLITLFNVTDGACLGCIYSGKISNETCETSGMLPAAAMIGAALQADEAVKILIGKNHEKDLVRIDLWNNIFIKIRIGKKLNCSAHNGSFEYLSGKGAKIVKMCGSNVFQIKGRKINLKNTKLRGKNLGYCIASEKITLFEDGRALVKAGSEAEAKSLYAKLVGN